MKLGTLASCLLLGLTLTACSNQVAAPIAAQSQHQQGIIGGTEVPAGHEVNLMTAALYDSINQAICTVSLIDKEWVLTAAHCVEGAIAEGLVIAFERDLVNGPADQQPVLRRVTHFVIHNQWSVTNDAFAKLEQKAKAEGREVMLEEVDAITDWGDYALVHLDGEIPSTHHVVPMLPADVQLQKGQPILLAGYGVSNGSLNTGDGILREVEITIAEPKRGTMELMVDQRQGKGACRGDSGGPAYVQHNGKLHLVGVTSHGAYDAKNDCSQFAVYSNVQAVDAWIKETMAHSTAPVVAARPVAAAVGQ